jgi:HAD superfamily hydrolase (TIGR01509 family)
LSGAVWARMMGRPDGERVALADLEAAGAPPLDDAQLRARRDRKRTLCDVEPLRPGAEELLRRAAEAGVTTAVVSSSSAAWVGHHLGRLGVSGHFAAVVTGEEAAHKPAPDLYLLALARVGVRPDEALALEDSPSGVRAAKSAGLRCFAVRGEAGGDAELSAADNVMAGLDEAVGLLSREEVDAW